MKAIEILNLMNYNVVEIINPVTQESEFYVYNRFDPDQDLGSRKVMKHVIFGQNVTSLLQERSTMFTMTNYKELEIGVRQLIDKLPQVKIEYSSHFIWKNYLIA
jgi:hypothetical protein